MNTINAIERCQPRCKKLDFQPEVDSGKWWQDFEQEADKHPLCLSNPLR